MCSQRVATCDSATCTPPNLSPAFFCSHWHRHHQPTPFCSSSSLPSMRPRLSPISNRKSEPRQSNNLKTARTDSSRQQQQQQRPRLRPQSKLPFPWLRSNPTFEPLPSGCLHFALHGCTAKVNKQQTSRVDVRFLFPISLLQPDLLIHLDRGRPYTKGLSTTYTGIGKPQADDRPITSFDTRPRNPQSRPW